MPRAEQINIKTLRYNGVFIGWFGAILSCFLLFYSAFSLHWRNELVEYCAKQLNKPDTDLNIRRQLMNSLIVTSSTIYAFALINILVCSMLLIGIAKRCAALLFPWLLYHGLLFGFGVHLIVYCMVSGVVTDFNSYMCMTACFAILLAIFYKIYRAVFLLFKTMDMAARIQLIPPMENHTQSDVAAAWHTASLHGVGDFNSHDAINYPIYRVTEVDV